MPPGINKKNISGVNIGGTASTLAAPQGSILLILPHCEDSQYFEVVNCGCCLAPSTSASDTSGTARASTIRGFCIAGFCQYREYLRVQQYIVVWRASTRITIQSTASTGSIRNKVQNDRQLVTAPICFICVQKNMTAHPCAWLVEACLSACWLFLGKRLRSTRRSRGTARADLQLPKELGLGLQLGSGWVWADVKDII